METTERLSVVGSIIEGIARRKAYKFKSKSKEDIVQDLWLKILEKEHSSGCELDLDLIAKICYDSINDMIRYEMRRTSQPLEDYFDEDVDREVNQYLYSKIGRPDDDDAIVIKDLINKFPTGSRERIFLEYWATASNYIDFNVEGEGGVKDGFTESDLAHKLGYSGTSSGGFKKFRNKMRVTVFNILFE